MAVRAVVVAKRHPTLRAFSVGRVVLSEFANSFVVRVPHPLLPFLDQQLALHPAFPISVGLDQFVKTAHFFQHDLLHCDALPFQTGLLFMLRDELAPVHLPAREFPLLLSPSVGFAAGWPLAFFPPPAPLPPFGRLLAWGLASSSLSA